MLRKCFGHLLVFQSIHSFAMKYLRILLLAAVAAFLCNFSLLADDIEMNRFIDNLMGKMTLEEKIGQLNLLPGNDVTTGAVMDSPLAQLIREGKLGAVLNVNGLEKIKELQEIAVHKSRLGIPLLFGLDVIHGNVTIMPIPLAQSCTWNLDLIEKGAKVAAKEATAQGINWNFSPMVDVSFDPRWGRVAEGGGEDAMLSGLIGAAMIRGYQGNFGTENMLACLKHFALYGASESGRDYNTVDMSRLRMWNQYLQSYETALSAEPATIMSSFNVVDYVPATANKWLISDVLRDKWGFSGMLVTDYASIYEMTEHGIGDLKSNAARALIAGTDMDMCSNAYSIHLASLLDEGKVKVADIDRACRRVLTAKYKLGLFSDPFKYCNPQRLTTDIYTDENRRVACELASQSFVLLKNDNNLLPLRKQGKIALIGPLADTRNNLPGCWSTADRTELYSTLRECMQKELDGKAELLYSQGCNIYYSATLQSAAAYTRNIPRVDDNEARNEALKLASCADVIICAMGELAEMSGESASRADLNLPDAQMDLLKALVSMGKPIVLLNFSGRPTVMTWESENIQAIMNVWHGGSESGDAICDVVFGTKSPCGRLTMTMPRSIGQIPIYYNYMNTGRPVGENQTKFHKYRSNYIDEINDPLYHFGYGLTYSDIEYSDLSIVGNNVKVTITNTGAREVTEVVQLYIHDIFASIVRPMKELKAFKRITLAAGEAQSVEFILTPDMLSFRDADGNKVIEAGDFEIMVGPSSADKDLLKTTYKYPLN